MLTDQRAVLDAPPLVTAGDGGRSDMRAGDRSLLERTMRRRVRPAILAANGFGAVVVFVVSVFVVPAPRVPPSEHLIRLNVIVFAVAMLAALPAGVAWGVLSVRSWSGWLIEGRPPTERERAATLRYPARLIAGEALLWGVGVAIFAALNGIYSAGLGLEVAAQITLGGLTTCAVGYLLTERLFRPITARALDDRVPRRPVGLGVRARLMLAWVFGTAIGVVAIGVLAVAALAHASVSLDRVALSVLLLSIVAFLTGLAAIAIAAHSVADPLRALRSAVAEVEAGRLDIRVPVEDASEVGLLQAAFNRMVAGLRERERLRDLFGRHVGEEVARQALASDIVRLGGETRHAAVLFVDLIASTRLAATRDATEVVATLNSFFGIVVEVVSRHGGWVNKFEGDAALCVFGAPTTHPDPATAALATARELNERLDREVEGVRAAIGVSAGTVVAGNVGAAERFEYTVVGDAVNEAARLTELAKRTPQRTLASDAVRAAASAQEARLWPPGVSVTLRGRLEPTRVAALTLDGPPG